jgi:hypothetical protein
MRLAGVLAACLLALVAGPAWAEGPVHRRLAEHYAPVIYRYTGLGTCR